jgi:hypothetical protein
MGRSYSWTARVNGRTVADGTTAGGDDCTPKSVETDATTDVALRTGAHASQIKVTVTERRGRKA